MAQVRLAVGGGVTQGSHGEKNPHQDSRMQNAKVEWLRVGESHWFLMPSQPFKLYPGGTQFKSKSFHSSKHIAGFVSRGLGENEVE